MNKMIDIISTGDYPSCALSNFYNREFVFDGVLCASAEGLLQAFKTKNVELQRKVCMLHGKEAKNFFRHRIQNFLWRITGNLYWNGKCVKRWSDDYQYLLDRVYAAMYQTDDFRKALIASEGYELMHSIGKHSVKETVLTEYEFLSRLEKYRSALK